MDAHMSQLEHLKGLLKKAEEATWMSWSARHRRIERLKRIIAYFEKVSTQIRR